jgi:hypothetical protein
MFELNNVNLKLIWLEIRLHAALYIGAEPTTLIKGGWTNMMTLVFLQEK